MRTALPFIRIGLGATFLVVGVAGLVLPILPGWMCIGIGLILLAEDLPPVKRFMRWIERRFPRIGRVLQKGRGFRFRKRQSV